MTQPNRVRPSRNAAPTVAPKMAAQSIEHLVLYLLRDPVVQAAADNILQADHFKTEPHFGAVWVISRQQRERYGRLTYLDLHREVGEHMSNAGALYTPLMCDQILYEDPNDRGATGTLHLAFQHLTDGEMNPEAGLELLRQFLRERELVEPIRTMLYGLGTAIPLDFGAIVEAAGQKQRAIDSLGVSEAVHPFADTEEEEEILTRDEIPMHVSALSRLMPYGMAAKEVYSVMAPPSFGKTTLLVDIAVSTAAYYVAQTDTRGVPLKTVRFYTWEGGVADVRWRMQANAARVQKQRLESTELRRTLTSAAANDLLEYERALQSNEPGCIRGERDRLQQARWMNRLMHIKDMQDKEAGNNLLAGVRADCEQAVLSGEQIGLIVIDHAMAIADAYILATGRNNSDMRHFLRQIANQATQLSSRFQCPIWIAHQSRSVEASKGAVKGKQGQGAECGAFEQPMNYSFVLSAPGANNISILTSTKDRRSGVGQTSVCVRLNGALQRIEDMSTHYMLDAGGRVMDRQSSQLFMGPGGQRQPTTPAPAATGGATAFVTVTRGGRRDGVV